MLIHFDIEYITKANQSLFLMLNFSDNFGMVTSQCLPMEVDDSFCWTVVFDCSVSFNTVSYKYAIAEDNKALMHEYGRFRSLDFLHISASDRVSIRDSWRVRNEDTPFSTIAFTQCIFKRKAQAFQFDCLTTNLVLRLHCPKVESNQHIAVVGNQSCLGNWDVNAKMCLDDSCFPYWQISLNCQDISFPLEYKYLLIDSLNDSVLAWSEGDNYKLNRLNESYLNIVNDSVVRFPTATWKAAGVAIPVFSLRSEKGFGVGELNDLQLMVDWASSTGQKMLQILPINDTTNTHTNADSYPYNAVSVYALHPMYLNVESIGILKDKEFLKSFQLVRQSLNASKILDYKLVMEWKWKYFKLIYQQECDSVFQTREFLDFFEKNRNWLLPYAAFSYLRDVNATARFSDWTSYSVYNSREIEELVDPKKSHYHEIAIYYYLQFHLHTQLLELRSYAHSKGIVLKGDIPIGVSPTSVDAWVHPELFNLQVQAGAPPDNFSITGQNWGFPTYNWELMAKDGYEWWRKRFLKLSDYFDAYRIDHILGFFRIWEIPSEDVWGLKGSFNPALPFSVQELEERGIQWNDRRYMQPYLSKSVIELIAGKESKKVFEQFVVLEYDGNYTFKSEFDTQRKIEAFFSKLGRELSPEELHLRDALYMMLSEVLFVRDLHHSDKLNPRISMQSSYTFQNLPEETREVLNTIYYDYFYHRHSTFWKEQALKKLPVLIAATDMLVCGEDLGMIPDTVPEVMRELEILSLEIQRMPKQPDVTFANPAEAPYFSVCTTSTHDMNPIRAWWKEDKSITQRFYNEMLAMEGEAPLECNELIAQKIIEQHLKSEAMWVVFPWQDWMAMDENLRHQNPLDERINVPSNPTNYWCYRMHITLESLLLQTNFNTKISTIIKNSKR